MRRRDVLALPLAPAVLRAAPQPVVLLRSGWQTENIGDIAHTPGLLRLLELHVPRARVILWSNALDRGVAAMLSRHFPNVRQVGGSPEELNTQGVFKEATFLLHGSGPGLVARNHVEAWTRLTGGKPWGAYGITVATGTEAASAKLDDALAQTLSTARFLFTRETRSLANLKAAGLTGPQLDFAPDATFSLNVRNDEWAAAFLRRNLLEPGKFLVVVPRLRYTPYHKMRKVDWSAETISHREAVNARFAGPDHDKLRQAITSWVRKTELRVLLAPEMTYQVELLEPLLRTPLPDDVRASVVPLRDYWITDAAASVYARAAMVLSMECHSPIIACANGAPGLYVHQPEDGIKGQMWRDLGMGDNYFDVDQADGAMLTSRVLDIAVNMKKERPRTRKAVEAIQKRQGELLKGVAASFA